MAFFNEPVPPTTSIVNPPTATSKPEPVSTSTTAPPPTRTATPTPTPEQAAPKNTPTHTSTAKPQPTNTPKPTITPKPPATTKPTQDPEPSPTSKPSSTSTFFSFEQFGSWTRGDQPYGEFIQSSEQFKGGSYSGKLTYDFPDVPADFVVFSNIISLSGQPTEFSAFVYGDGSGHYLNMWVQDAANQIWSIHLGAVGGPGWKKLVGYLDPNLSWPNGHIAGPNNGKVDYPVRFHSLVLDRPDTGPRQGIIYIDRLAAQ
jgi:hypothetical protein